MTKKEQIAPIEVIESSGNVFQDLNIPDAEEYLVKAKLAHQINTLTQKLGLKTQAEAAKYLGVDQPKISAIRRGQLTDFSLERLMGYLNKLDQDVTIVIQAKPQARRDHGHLCVAFA